MDKAKEQKEQTFEEAIGELESTVAKLEHEGITLDESLELFSRGVELSAKCKKILDDVEGRILKLVESAEGGIKEEEFT